MPIYITAKYQVKFEAVDEVKKAIEKFTAYIKAHEKGTRLYMAWQDIDDQTKFTHVFIFENEEAQLIHRHSEAVKEFEEVYSPNLVHGPVIFTHFQEVATNQ